MMPAPATTGRPRAAGRRSASEAPLAQPARGGRPQPARKAQAGREGRKAAPRRAGDRPPGRGGRQSRGRPERAPNQALHPAVTVVGGLIWSVIVLAAVGLSPVAAEVVLIPVAVVASASASRALAAGASAGRSRRRRGPDRSRALALVAVTGSVVVPLAALAGAGAAVPALVVLVLVVVVTGSGPTGVGATAAVTVVAGPALAAMSVVLARHQSASHALAVVAATLVFDAGAFMMGNARTPSGGPVGMLSGLAGVAVVALFVAAVMNPPFSGVRPWAVFAVVGVLAAVGARLAERAVPEARVPALRRLDSLMLAAPAWVACMAVLSIH